MANLMKSVVMYFLIGCCPIADAGELSELYSAHAQRKYAKNHSKARSRDKRPAKGVPPSEGPADGGTITQAITEIGIEQDGGGLGGAGPDYTLIAMDDGTCRYEGRENVERIGKFTGTIPRRYFTELARFIKDSEYMALHDEYSRNGFDGSTIYTTVVMDGKRHIVKDYMDGGPSKLWAIEQLIDRLLDQAVWDEKEQRPDGAKD